MKKKIILLLSCFVLTGCTIKLPFQSEEFPAWKTDGLINYKYNSHNEKVEGYVANYIGEEIKAYWYNYTVNSFKEINSYEGYEKENNNNVLYLATVTVTNTFSVPVKLFDTDFALVWDFLNDDLSYSNPVAPVNDKMLKNDMEIGVGETKTIELLYEVDKDIKKPFAINYFEYFEDQTYGNFYYTYVE